MTSATFKGSPGPWTADVGPAAACFDRKIPIRGGVTAYGRPYVIAHVNRPGSAFLGHDKANATLIAAAPETLAELQALYRAYVRLLEAGRERIVDHGGSCDPVDVMEEGDPALIKARAAIAKALTPSSSRGDQ